MSLTRTTHWATREFDMHLRTYAKTPFAWGTNDCAMAAASAIQSFTGVDIASDFRGKYTNLAAAQALIKKVTGGAGSTLEDAVVWCAAKHKLVEYKFPKFAQRGDLVLMQQPTAEPAAQLIAGVVHLTGAHLVTVAEHGLVRLPITAVRRAWKI